MTVHIQPRSHRRVVWLSLQPGTAHAAQAPAHTAQELLALVRQLNRYLRGSGLVALMQPPGRVLLLGLKCEVSSEDLMLVLLWLARQPRVRALALEAPTPLEARLLARYGYGQR